MWGDTLEEKRVECPVRVDPHRMMGVYTNAFRIVPGDDEECVLDFFLYSSVEGKAVLVSRVWVHIDLLPSIRETLSEVATDLSDVDLVGVQGTSSLLD